MRILFFTHYSALYGANKSLIGLLEGFKKFDVEMLVVIPNEGEICVELERLNIKYKVLSFTPWVSQILKPKKLVIPRIKQKIRILFLFIKRFREKNKETSTLYNSLINFSPDLIYSNSSTINIGFELSKRFKCKHIWHLRELGIKHYKIKYFYRISFVKKSFRKSDLLIAISNDVKEFYEKFAGNKNIILLYDGIYTENQFKLIQNRKRSINNIFTYCIVGLISKNKHQETAIKAFKLVNDKCKNTKLVIVGSGDKSRLLKLVKSYNLINSVQFLGFVRNPYLIYSKIDTLLMCSEFEAMGRVTLESMAFGIPVIGNYSGGTKDLIIDGVNGYFYNNNDNIELADKMLFLLNNKSLCSSLGKRGEVIFEENYLLEDYCKRVYSVFCELKKTK